MAQSIFGLIFFVALLLSGCTSNEIVRTIALKSKSSECDFKGHAADLSYFTKKKNKKDIDCTQYSIEDHEDYTLGIVEFDDQGWLHNRKQMDLLMEFRL